MITPRRVLFFALLTLAISASGRAQAPLDKLSAAKDVALPSWLTLGLEDRGRIEATSGIGFDSEHQDTYYLHRLRLNAGVRIKPWLRFSAQLQDSRAPGWEAWPPPSTVRNTTELRFAHVDLTPARGWLVRAGRQPLKFGSARLLSTSTWGNVGPAYDGARVGYADPRMKLDWFASYKVRPADGEFDWCQTDRKLWGFYSSWLTIPKLTLLDAYMIGVDYNQAMESFQGFGGRLVDRLGARVDAEAEFVYQRGHIASEPLSAWGGNWLVGYRLNGNENSPRVYFDYAYASGDGTPGDGVNQTFQQLYPTHKWSTAESIAWRNIHEPLLGLTFQPSRKWILETRFRSFWLATKQDCLYGLSGCPIACNSEAGGSHVGEELDARAAYSMSRHLTLMFGAAKMWAGRYLRDSTPGGSPGIVYAMWDLQL